MPYATVLSRAGHDPLLPYGQGLGEKRRTNGHEGVLLDGRRGEPGIVPRQIDLEDEIIGGRDAGGDPASARSLAGRSCSVPNIRSLRPRASGE